MPSEDTKRRLAKLEDQVSLLQEQLAALATEVEGQRGLEDGSMRSQVRCPACRGRKILHAREIVDRIEPGSHRKMSVSYEGFWSPKAKGSFECHICMACGLVEWHVKDPSEIKIDEEKLEILEVDDRGPGPYR